MRQATEQWQQEVGDTGMVPEAVLMEEMKPDGITPMTDPPKIAIDGHVVSLSCPTDGASIVYQLRRDDGWSRLAALHKILCSRRGEWGGG